jgi:hypothetical protein
MVVGFKGPLPGGQWRMDVEHWLATWLIAMQAPMVNVAVGVDDEVLELFLVTATALANLPRRMKAAQGRQ